MHRARFAAVCAALVGILIYGLTPVFSAAQSADTSSGTSQEQQIAQLNQEIATYQADLQKVGADKKTLQAAINTLDLQKKKLQAQVTLTQTKINVAQTKISQLGKGIAADQENIRTSQAALGKDIRAQAEDENRPVVVQVLSGAGLTDVWNEVEDMMQVNDSIQSNVQTLRSQSADLANSQDQTKATQSSLVAQKATLTSQQKDLTATTQQKTQLLAQTNAQESKYQQLLAQAEAQLNSFSNFSQNAGGSGILSNQTVCDSWGCYFNQRDALWGSESLDGTNYTMKSDGCLVTAMAMVMTHYGATGVTPATINNDPSNFAAYEPAYLLLTINAGGMTATRKVSTIDATLASGNPVIVGVKAYGGTHYVVLVSGSGGNYVMKDPYIPNGNDISFAEHYTMRSVFAIDKVSVS